MYFRKKIGVESDWICGSSIHAARAAGVASVKVCDNLKLETQARAKFPRIKMDACLPEWSHWRKDPSKINQLPIGVGGLDEVEVILFLSADERSAFLLQFKHALQESTRNKTQLIVIANCSMAHIHHSTACTANHVLLSSFPITGSHSYRPHATPVRAFPRLRYRVAFWLSTDSRVLVVPRRW